MINRKILKMADRAKNNVIIEVKTDCAPFLTVLGVAEVKPTPIVELVVQGKAERHLVDEDYALYVICKGQVPGTSIEASVTGKAGGATSTTTTVNGNGDGLLKLTFFVSDGKVQP